MVKKKNAEALFEIISKTREKRSEAGLGVPAWMGRGGDKSEQPHPDEAAVAPEVSTPREISEFAPPRPVLSTTEGRLRISLSYVQCMLVFLAFVLLLGVGFALGRYGGAERGEVGTVASFDSPAPETDMEGADTTPPVAEDPWVVGKFYPVIQNLRGKTPELKGQAYKIRDFCAANGYPSVVRELRGSYVVVGLRGFDSIDDPAVEGYAMRIEALGKEYLTQGGRYNFMQRRTPGAKLDPMLVKAVEE